MFVNKVYTCFTLDAVSTKNKRCMPDSHDGSVRIGNKDNKVNSP